MNIILKSLTWLLVFFCLFGCWILNLPWKKKTVIFMFYQSLSFLSYFLFVKLCLWAEVTLQSQSYLMTLIWQRNHKKINCTELFFFCYFEDNFLMNIFVFLSYLLVGRCCHSSVQRWRFWCLSWSGIIACRAIGRNWRT